MRTPPRSPQSGEGFRRGRDVDEVVTGRAGPEGVRRLLRGGRPRAVLRRALAGMLEDGAAFGPLRLRRAKFRPGRVQAYYEVPLRAREFDLPGLRWIHVAWAAPSSGADVSSNGGSGTPASSPLRILMAGLPREGLRIQISPYDPNFPRLRHLADPGYVSGLLGRPYAVTALRYRPGQRHVLRFDPAGPAGRGRPLFVKLYQEGEALALWSLQRGIADAIEAAGVPLQLLRPTAHLAADAALLFPSGAGVPLSRRLVRSPREASTGLVELGTGLRHLHRAPVPPGLVLPSRSFEQEVRTAARANEHLRALMPEVATMAAELFDRAQILHGRLPAGPQVPCHGDLKTDHVLVRRDGCLTLIDLDRVGLGDAAIDAGRLLADLRWWLQATGQPGLAQAQAAFLEAWAPDAEPEALASCRLCESVAFVRIALHRTPLADAAWEPRIRQSVGTALALLRRAEDQFAAF